jgi:hypothetical protein
MGWMVRQTNPGGARFSAPVQTGPGAHPASYTMGTGSFQGVKRPAQGVDHHPHLAPRWKKSGTLPLLPLWAFVAYSGETLLTLPTLLSATILFVPSVAVMQFVMHGATQWTTPSFRPCWQPFITATCVTWLWCWAWRIRSWEEIRVLLNLCRERFKQVGGKQQKLQDILLSYDGNEKIKVLVLHQLRSALRFTSCWKIEIISSIQILFFYLAQQPPSGPGPPHSRGS